MENYDGQGAGQVTVLVHTVLLPTESVARVGTDNEGGRYLMVTDKPLRPRSCAGPIRAGVRRRDISRHYTSVCGY